MTFQYYADCLVEGDGAKYALIDDQYIPLVCCSMTDRLIAGNKYNIIIKTDNGDKSGIMRTVETVWQWPIINGIPTKSID